MTTQRGREKGGGECSHARHDKMRGHSKRQGGEARVPPTLLSAMMKGVLRARSRLSDSIVCGSRPCITSTTRMAMSHRLEPRDRRLVNDSWPGVSMMRRPGTLTTTPGMEAVRSRMASAGKKVAPICCVMPPASPSWTLVRRRLSSSFVLPVSTWPMMTWGSEGRRERGRGGVIASHKMKQGGGARRTRLPGKQSTYRLTIAAVCPSRGHTP